MTRWLQPGDAVVDPLAPYREVDRRAPGGRPWVLANMVGGLDGSAAVAGRVGALSSPTDATLFRLLRGLADVVLVGAATVRAEGYGPARLPDEAQDERRAAGRAALPAIAVVSRTLDLDLDSALFAAGDGPDDGARTVVVTCEAAEPGRLATVRERARVVLAGGDRVDPALALAALGDLGAGVVLCEGGPTLLGELVGADLLDELCLTVEPLMGGDPLPLAVAPGASHLVRFRLAHVLVDADTLFLRYERDRTVER